MGRQFDEQERDWLDRFGVIVEDVFAICCVCVIGLACLEMKKDRERN